MGTDYKRPAPLEAKPIPQSYSAPAVTNVAEWKAATPAANLPRGSWWELFGDPELAKLESSVVANNQQLRVALARFEQAQAQIKVSQAQLFPTVAVVPTYTRQRTSFNEPDNGHAAGIARNYSTFTLPLQAGWELDLWGRVRRQVESARATAVANADDLEASKLALEAELATDYFTLRALDREYDVVLRTTETFRRSLELTVNRRKGGIATDFDVSLAETQLRTAEAELPGLRLQRAKLLHAIATLCGETAIEFSLSAGNSLKTAEPEIPLGLPSELLERRPDVAAAEQRMASANAQIGIAQSAFFPSVRLDGLAGLQSVSASTLFNWPSRLWSVGPTLDLPLFTGGKNRAQLALAKAGYNETVASYRQTVLGAFQEVEDQLAAQQHLQSQIAAEVSALEAAQRTVGIADNRYRAGLITYLEVASSQNSALSLERTVAQLQGQRLVATVGLIRALGGGWQATQVAQQTTR